MNLIPKSIAVSALSVLSIILLSGLYMASRAQDADPVFKRLDIQGYNVNIRAEADAKSAVLEKANYREAFQVIERGKAEAIGGKEDYWYKVQLLHVDPNAPKSGWIFGAFTSLRQEGRKKLVMTFEGCTSDYNGFVHRHFKEQSGKKWDIYDQGHNFIDYELCATIKGSDNQEGDKRYVGKRFEVVMNDIIDPPFCKKSPEECGKMSKAYSKPKVIFLRLVK
jgi:hypothetical protein